MSCLTHKAVVMVMTSPGAVLTVVVKVTVGVPLSILNAVGPGGVNIDDQKADSPPVAYGTWLP